MTESTLVSWGFAPHVQAAAIAAGLDPATIGRVIEEQRDAVLVRLADGEAWARPSGRYLHEGGERPAVGDFVALRPIEPGGDHAWRLVDGLVPRRTRLARAAVGGKAAAQVMAANVDTVFVATSANLDLNERRVERYLTAIREAGAMGVVLLTKADLAEDAPALVARLQRVARAAPVHAVSALTGDGMRDVVAYLEPRATVAIVGSSGVGKSTLTNWLAGVERQAVQEIGAGLDKGRHTTTTRSLAMLPSGAMLIDTPGMREIAAWDAVDATSEVFDDVEALAASCRYGDCAHDTEPDCAVRAALARGELAADRLESYAKLRREQAFLARRADQRLAADEKRRWKQITKSLRSKLKEKRR